MLVKLHRQSRHGFFDHQLQANFLSEQERSSPVLAATFACQRRDDILGKAHTHILNKPHAPFVL